MVDPKNTTIKDPAAMLTENLPVPAADPNSPLPSVESNQQATIEEQQRQAKLQADLDKKRKEMLSQTRTGVASKEITDLEAQSEILQDIKKKEADEARIKSDEDLDRLAEKAKTDALISEYQNLKQEYTQRGLDFKTEPALEALLAEQEQAQEAVQQKAIEAQQKQIIEEQQKEQMKEDMAVQAEKVAIKQDIINQKATQKAAVEESLADQRQNYDIQRKMQEEDKSQNFTNFNEYWQTRSTGQKILTGIGLFLGMFGGKDGNGALKVINDAIEKNIESKKVSQQDYWKQREYDLRVTAEQTKRMGANTANDALKLKYAQLNQQLMQEAQKANNMRAVNERLRQNRPLTRSEVFDLKALNPQLDENRLITVGTRLNPETGQDEALQVYTSEVGEKTLTTVRESIVSAEKSMKDVDKLLELAEMPLGGSFNIITARPEAQAAVQSLIGNMRLELFGPGVLTDMEMKLAKNIAANPTDIFKLSASAKTSLRYIKDKLKYAVKQNLRTVGVITPTSDNDKNVAKLRQQGLSQSDAIETLQRSNKWKEESVTGF